MKEDTKDLLKIAGAGIAVVSGVAIIGVGLGWFSLITGRPMAKYQTETSAQVYDTSRQYQQGTNRDVARYCNEMRSAPSPAARKSVAALIRSTTSTYDGPLSPDNQDCISEAKEI
jgi:hypothetical protein